MIGKRADPEGVFVGREGMVGTAFPARSMA
jgi:hypothetical protein